jgi:hypothetical protein
MTTEPIIQENPQPIHYLGIFILSILLYLKQFIWLCFTIVNSTPFKISYYIYKIYYKEPFHYTDMAWIFLKVEMNQD